MNIIHEIRKLAFPLDEYVVVGSAPMAVRGLKVVHDIDIVVTPRLFQKCKRDGWRQIPWTYPERLGQVYLRRGFVELYLDVNCATFKPTTDELIQRADVISGIPFATLQDILQFKKVYANRKHASDIMIIEEYLAAVASPTRCPTGPTQPESVILGEAEPRPNPPPL